MTTPAGSAGSTATVAGQSSVNPGWQGPKTYTTTTATQQQQITAEQQAQEQATAAQEASGVLGSFFGSGSGPVPYYSPSYQNQYAQAYSNEYAQLAQQGTTPAASAQAASGSVT